MYDDFKAPIPVKLLPLILHWDMTPYYLTPCDPNALTSSLTVDSLV